jgi:arabinose-5-phosphate isomerase
MGNRLIALVGDTSSYLATHSDIVINSTVEKEACPNNLAPTTSTTAQMVMGDALAVCLMEMKGFKTDDFARYHPGGALGKKLFLRVSDLTGLNTKPMVKPDAPVKDVIVEITRNRLGAVAVLDEKGYVAGIITDGDIRRMMEKFDSIANLKASDIMGKDPRRISPDAMAVEALELMRKHNISQLLVTQDDIYEGVIHLHDLLREGIL